MENNNNTVTFQSELLLRLFSAFVMVSISLAGTYLGGWYFTGLIFFVAMLMMWEWYTLTDCRRLGISYVVQCAALLLASYFAATHDFLLSCMVLIGSAIIVFVLAGLRVVKGGAPIWTAMGSLYIGLPSMGMIWFREDPAAGFAAVFFLFTLSWSSDSAAFFGGRTIGGAKLAPVISPNKTWSGFFSGLFACALVGSVFALFLPEADLSRLVLISIVLGVAVQIGDLAESAMKRYFGLKDSSSLIPGHGGILDRVDGLVFAVSIAALFAMFVDSSNPGAALLYGGAAEIESSLLPGSEFSFS